MMNKTLIEWLRSRESYDCLVKEAVSNHIERLEAEWYESLAQIGRLSNELLFAATYLRATVTELTCSSNLDVTERLEKAVSTAPMQESNALLYPYKEHIERLRESLSSYVQSDRDDIKLNSRKQLAQEVLAATPAHSFTRHNNEIMEKCAVVADAWEHDKRIAAAIRSMKEPE